MIPNTINRLNSYCEKNNITTIDELLNSDMNKQLKKLNFCLISTIKNKSAFYYEEYLCRITIMDNDIFFIGLNYNPLYFYEFEFYAPIFDETNKGLSDRETAERIFLLKKELDFLTYYYSSTFNKGTFASTALSTLYSENISDLHPSDEFHCRKCGLILREYSEYDPEEDANYEFVKWNYCPRCGAVICTE